jgi:hypothetical protein
MSSEIKPLEVLKGKRITSVETGIDLLVGIDSDEHEPKIEIPLRLFFEQYSLSIYNQWSIITSSPSSICRLKGAIIIEILIDDEILTLKLDNTDNIRINLNDSAYTGPEAMVLHGPGNSIVVWN